MTDRALLDDLLAGKIPALARAVSIVENARPGFEGLLAALHPRLGAARRIGVTGPPGAGKSTLTMQLVSAWRRAGLRVGVVAVDPTSPFTGGALLGDRIRMEQVALDPGVFIRSMATRGSLGGITTSTREVCDLLDAAGFDRVLVETVGVGQSELEVQRMTDTTVLVLVPESGDGIQALKSGVMEAADVFVVNKADRQGAPKLRREIELALDLRAGRVARGGGHHGALGGARQRPDAQATPEGWRPPVLLTTAAKAEGIDELLAAIDAHWDAQSANGLLEARRRARLADRMHAVVGRAVDRWLWTDGPARELVAARLDAAARGATSPYDVAAEVLAAVREGVQV
ncbi:MAG: methylmalonyl Co-A mutase-associated GTPase MeaB [Gemmatimonadetes bacterium]|nr:methylmalonyl Co-A mutase-associated GTPase MeaB [Gemmatimonadota bacterium]MCB9517510.1 methylmalonyl Co-A mutase-associated GTPase MeaB [Gemmatimonadales bacterium]HPF60861.1 methylmalonyl Co-A mutase-associated GTPase MeaB [Gemmatimonadales bacterium]HRX19491.1 methylmalonyl Co-A mutase-associated GTPase MeaB [Gemmatimonadales bacterium]